MYIIIKYCEKQIYVLILFFYCFDKTNVDNRLITVQQTDIISFFKLICNISLYNINI